MENRREDKIPDDNNSDNKKIFYVLDETENDEIPQADSNIYDEKMEVSFDEACSSKYTDEACSNRYSPDEDEELEMDYKVLIEKGESQPDLPDGWVQLPHESGMPIYMNIATKVCTMAKPYALGNNSVRNHKVPKVAIPCLNYQKALKSETQTESAEEQTACNLEHAELHEYCKKVFDFETIQVKRFPSWPQHNQYYRGKKIQKRLSLDRDKLLFVNIYKNNNSILTRTQNKYIINPIGKPYISILQEYIQAALGIQPKYVFKEMENANGPHAATVFIDDMQYGTGYGTNKKKAKKEAAEVTLKVIIPNLDSKMVSDSETSSCINPRMQDYDLSFFDEIKITDPQVAEYCTKIEEPLPYRILQTCLKRNIKLGSIQVSYQENYLKPSLNDYKITVANQTATVICKNKQDGKQQAAQEILQKLHPFIEHWGSMLRLYGNQSHKFLRGKELEPQNEDNSIGQPCQYILSQLQSEFAKLNNKSDSKKRHSKKRARITEYHEANTCNTMEPGTSNSRNADAEFRVM